MAIIRASTEWETEFLIKIISLFDIPKKVYVEIGGLKGGSLRVMGNIIDKNGLLISIDIVGSEKLQKTIKDFSETHKTHLIIKDSHLPETKNLLLKQLDGKLIDILFIDGDHTLLGAVKDTIDYTSLVTQNGLIIFHDCGIINAEMTKAGSKVINGVHPCFQSFVYNKPYILLQEWSGLGIVINRPLRLLENKE